MMVEDLSVGELDVIGDVHGEIDSLRALLEMLGYAEDGKHPEGRRLVFVGDLVDRGPDSAGVVKLVSRMIEAGNAQCVLGNHELNILRESRKHDNTWFFEETDSATQDEIMRFIAERPLALERPGLRVVHACWHSSSIDAARANGGGVLEFFSEAERTIAAALDAEGLAAEAERQKSQGSIRDAAQRVPWWNDYDDDSMVIVGHYWRSREPGHSFVDEPGLFGDAGPTDPVGPARRVMCIDYSIGRRPMERAKVGHEGPFQSALAAYRLRDGEPGEVVFSPG